MFRTQYLMSFELDSPSSGLPLHKVLVLVGPTCSGKTSVSLILGARLKGEIVSADSRQIYKYMDIGTAKLSAEERGRIRHYFIDELMPDQDFNAGEYGRHGRALIDDICRRGKLPIVVGGSGLYIQSLIDGFFGGPPRDEELRKQLTGRLRREGGQALLNELERVDPVSAAKMLPTNTRRIIRALEVYKLTGLPLSEHHRTQKLERTSEPVFVGLDWERRLLYQRINARVDAMIEAGLVEEVKAILARGYSADVNALQTVGYQEAIKHLRGALSWDGMVDLIKQNSRRYAKRQLTWFRRDKRIRWFRLEGEIQYGSVAQLIADYLEMQLSRS